MSDAPLEVTVLGSGTSTGVPVAGCECAVCTSTHPHNQRSRCSILLHFCGRNVLIDTSTDFRLQALRERIRTVDAVLYTHSHADHVHGIDDLRPYNKRDGTPIPIFGAEPTIAALRRFFPYIFDEEPGAGYLPRLAPQVLTGPIELLGMPVVPVPIDHGGAPALGYRIGPFAYLTDCSAIPEGSWPLLEGVDTLLIDGLRFKPHQSHFNIHQALEVGRRLGATRTILTHLSHDVDAASHPETLPPGSEFAYDGQRLSFYLEGR